MKKHLFLFPLFSLFFSCSLKYDEYVDSEDKVPEFVFQNAVVNRYENNAVTLEVSAELLEQYKGKSETYAKNLSFKAYEDGKVTTEGSCGLLMTDTDKEFYELYDDIKLYNNKDKLNFFADVLKWNAKTEQLTSGRGDMVRIEKDDAVIRGTGFSASGVSQTFSFRGTVTGEIESK